MNTAMRKPFSDPGKADERALCERRLNDFARSTSGWFWEMDAHLRFVYFSPNVEEVTGVAPEWHYGKSREELGLHESVGTEQWQAHLDTLQRKEPFRDFIFQRRGPDGLKWMQTSGVPIFDESGKFCGYRGNATDVTAQILAEQRGQELVDAIEHLSETFALWDSDDRLITCNARFRELNKAVIEATRPGTPFLEHIKFALRARLYPRAVGREEEWLAERIGKYREGGSPMLIERQDGCWIQVVDHRLPNGSTATISTDVTESQHLRQELEWLASNDSLTEVLNRRGFMALARTEFARARRYDRHMAFLMLDIDRFKQLNDEHSHAAGDEALREVSSICQSALRDQDEIGRLGGEEFGVLLPETAPDEAAGVAERLRSTVEQQTSGGTARYGTITLSIGGANRASGTDTLDMLIRAADSALYDAKRAGRNCVRMAAEDAC